MHCLNSGHASGIFASAARPCSSGTAAPLASKSFPIALRHSATILFAMALPASSSAAALRLAVVPRRPGQQQTSSGGEEYSGLASNLAHLGRIY